MERRSHIYGVMGEFATPEQLTHAVEKVREAGYHRLDAYAPFPVEDRKSTRLNSSHLVISYAVFCLKKKIVIILLLHFLSLMLGSVLVLMLPLLVWLTPDRRITKRLLKCNWTTRKRLPRCKVRRRKGLLDCS